MRVLLSALVLSLVASAAIGEELFVPGVAQRQGQDGAWWNTEVWISNPSASTGSYAVTFLPAGQPNLDGLREDAEPLDLAPGVTVFRNDLVPQGGVGTLRIVTTPGVVVLARVFNSAGRGSFGGAVPALARSAAIRPGEVAQLIGLRRTPQYRTNVALFNPTPDHGVVRLRLIGQNGEVVGEEAYRLAAGGYVQLDDVLHGFSVSRGEHLRAEVSGTVSFFAQASVIDSRSGSPTLVSPQR